MHACMRIPAHRRERGQMRTRTRIHARACVAGGAHTRMRPPRAPSSDGWPLRAVPSSSSALPPSILHPPALALIPSILDVSIAPASSIRVSLRPHHRLPQSRCTRSASRRVGGARRAGRGGRGRGQGRTMFGVVRERAMWTRRRCGRVASPLSFHPPFLSPLPFARPLTDVA